MVSFVSDRFASGSKGSPAGLTGTPAGIGRSNLEKHFQDTFERMGWLSKCILRNVQFGFKGSFLFDLKVGPLDGGATLAMAYRRVLAMAWRKETGPDVPMPIGWERWGWDEQEEFSARRAMDALEESARSLA